MDEIALFQWLKSYQESLNLSFSHPWAFFLVFLPLFVYFLSLVIEGFSPLKNKSKRVNQANKNNLKQQSLKIPEIAQLGILAKYISPKRKSRINFLSWFLAIFSWILMSIALTNPLKISEPVSITREARDLMIAIDLSHSMASNDFNFQNQIVDRLSATKWVVNSFIEQRKGDRIGLILFADQAFTQSPLTFDLQSIKTFLDESQVGLVGEKTAIGDAIALAARKYSGIDSNDTNLSLPVINNSTNLNQDAKAEKILILLTDGANNTGRLTPLEAADLAKEVGLKIYTISIGPDFVQQGIGLFARRIPRTQYADEQTLIQVSQMTGGEHFFAGNANQLNQVYELINNLEPIEQESQVFRYQTSYFHYPLALAFFSLLMLIFNLNRRFDL